MSYQAPNYGGSSSCVLELKDLPGVIPPVDNDSTKEPDIQSLRHLSRPESQTQGYRLSDEAVDGGLPTPTTAVEQVHRWNNPRINMFRTFSMFWGFVVMGANDGALGVCSLDSEQ